MTIKNDNWIRQQAAAGMIEPFAPNLVRAEEDHTTFPGWVQPRKVLSYGCSSYGYDIRLSPGDFQIFRHVPGTVMNPKRFNPANLEPAELQSDEDGSYFILPAHSYGLGVAIERIVMPPTVTGICIGKSTYARCFTGDTEVFLVDGSSETFEGLVQRAENGEQLWGFGMTSDGETIVQELTLPRMVDDASELVRVTIDDGTFVDCTPDHQFLLRDGSYAEAKDLAAGTSLMPCYVYPYRGYLAVFNSTKRTFASGHHLAYDWRARNCGASKRQHGEHVHHKDENKMNNNPFNLEKLSREEHMSQHNTTQKGKDAAEYFWQSDEFKEKQEEIIARLHSPEIRAKAMESLNRYRRSEQGRAAISASSKKTWETVSDERRQQQREICRQIKLRADITEDTLKAALLRAGTIRGAAQVLKVDRSAFRRFPHVMEDFKAGRLCNNHKVKSVTPLPHKAPVYCLTAPETGNFALANGVFVHNCGLIANLTPTEAGWKGHLTLEFSNSSGADCRLYANEGICQVLFFEGEPCDTTYHDRSGKYQDQGQSVTVAKV